MIAQKPLELGVMAFVTDRSMPITELAVAVEERSIESLFLPEHTHIPVSRLTPFPAGEPMPDHYRRTIDPYIGLAAAAAVTKHVVLGTAISLVAQRDPIVTAKAVASIDLLSRGRFMFGVGYGWNVEEVRNHGIDPSTRRDRVSEALSVMKSLWANDEGSFMGDHFRVEPSWQWPKPTQRPRPPILLGAFPSPQTWDRVIDISDGWFSLAGGRRLGEQVESLRRRAAERGRDPSSIRVVTGTGKLDDEVLDFYEDLGVERAVFPIESSDRDETLAALDVVARTLTRRRGE